METLLFVCPQEGGDGMSVSQAVLYALFCMLVVFVVLVVLWGIIRLFSLVIGLIEERQQNRN